MDGRSLTFEVFGLLQGVLTMIDRETSSVWTHLEGKAIRGTLQGKRLDMVPLPQMTWGEWKASHPDTLVLSPDTPFRNRYRQVRIGRFSPQEAEFGDGRLRANALVVGVEVAGQFKGYPVDELREVGGVINDTLAGEPIVVIYDGDSQTGLAYNRVVDGQVLELYNAASPGVEIRDRQTESLWDRQGQAFSGTLAGVSLAFISEWYGWSGYHPETMLFGDDP